MTDNLEKEFNEKQKELEETNTLLEKIRIAEADLLRQKRELEQKKYQAERERASIEQKVAENKPYIITVTDFDKGVVTFSMPRLKQLEQHRHSPVLDILRDYRSRIWDSTTELNRIAVKDWFSCRERLEKLPKVVISTKDPLISLKIKKYQSLPDYEIISSEKEGLLEIIVHKGKTSVIWEIPGVRKVRTKGSDPERFLFQIVDILTISRRLQKYNTKWAPELSEQIDKEIERREKVELLLSGEVPDFPKVFQNGYELKGYQKTAAEFGRLADGRFLILDQVGLGKTWEFLAYAEWFFSLEENKDKQCIIVTPAGAQVNWLRMVYNLTGHHPFVCKGYMPDQHHILTLFTKKPRYVAISYTLLGYKAEVHEKEIQTAAGMMRAGIKDYYPWVQVLNKLKPALAVFDEFHKIKNQDASRTKAALKLELDRVGGLSATPIVNRPGEYWPMLYIIRPDLFPDFNAFLASYTTDGVNPKNVEGLREILRPLAIRRLKREVMKDLPEIARKEHYHDLSNTARDAYNRVLVEGVYKAIEGENKDIEKDVPAILAQIQRLKQICGQDKIEHTADLAIQLWDNKEEGLPPNRGKVIIFSQWKDTCRAIKARLGQEALLITGDITNKNTRMEMCDSFQTDPDIHFLVATQGVIGESLTLTAADYVVFNDLFWTPAEHIQCEGRAYGRANDPHPIDSYFIIANIEIELWMQDLLARKLRMFDKIVDGADEDPEMTKSIVKDLIKKLKDLKKESGIR